MLLDPGGEIRNKLLYTRREVSAGLFLTDSCLPLRGRQRSLESRSPFTLREIIDLMKHAAVGILLLRSVNIGFAKQAAKRFARRHRAEIATWLNGVEEYSLSYEQFPLDPHVIAAVRAVGYTVPTPIQRQAIPIVLQGHNLMGLAQTGTGEAAAFVLRVYPMGQEEY